MVKRLAVVLGFSIWVLWVVPSSAAMLSLELKGRILDQYGSDGVARLERWEAFLFDYTYASVEEKLEAVNRFFNQLPAQSDQDHWQQADYWATPVEMLASNGGDCEDFAIAKYFTLRYLGVPAEALRITYVKSLALNQSHMVLTYYPLEGEALVLDNLNSELLPASARPDLVPVYNFNGEGLWQAKQNYRDQQVGVALDADVWWRLHQQVSKELLQ